MDHLRFKDSRLEEEWNSGRLCPLLVKVVGDLVAKRWKALRQDTVATCIFRTMAENKAVGAGSLTHVEWRAVDLRVDPTQLIAEMGIRVEMNEKWPVDGGNMPRIAPLDHGTALHFHVQVSRFETRRT